MSPGTITPEQWLNSLPVVAADNLQTGMYYMYRGQAPGITNPILYISQNSIHLVRRAANEASYWYFNESNNVFERTSLESANTTLDYIKAACGITRSNSTRVSANMTKDKISGILATV